MTETLAVVACVVLAALSVFQVGLAAGRPWGRLAFGGGHEVLPPKFRVASGLAIVTYGLMAVVITSRAGFGPLLAVSAPAVFGAWVFTVYLVIGVVMNAASRSRLERLVMTPVAALLAVCFATVAAS